MVEYLTQPLCLSCWWPSIFSLDLETRVILKWCKIWSDHSWLMILESVPNLAPCHNLQDLPSLLLPALQPPFPGLTSPWSLHSRDAALCLALADFIFAFRFLKYFLPYFFFNFKSFKARTKSFCLCILSSRITGLYHPASLLSSSLGRSSGVVYSRTLLPCSVWRSCSIAVLPSLSLSLFPSCS